MTDTTGQGKTTSHRRRNFLIALAVAVCVIAIYILWGANALPASFHRFAKSPPIAAFSHAQTTAPLVDESRDPAAMARILAAQKTRFDEPGWQDFLNKIAALLKDGKLDVCGLPDLEAAIFVAGNGEMDMRAANAALAETAGKLIDSHKPRDQAIGLYVRAIQADWMEQEEAVNQLRCKGDIQCTISAQVVNPQARQAPAALLATLALTAADPGIYAAAIYACAGARTGACGAINFAGWARLEPDNAAAWLMVAHEAAASKDFTARDDAYQHFALAKNYDPRMPSLAPVFDAETMQAQPLLVQNAIGGAFIGANAAATITSTIGLNDYCLRGVVMDHARRRSCDTLINKMLMADSSLIDLVMATAIGKKIGWDAARLQALKDERDVVQGLAMQLMFGGNAFSCASLAKSNQWLRAALGEGELAIGRDYVAKSGKTLSELAEKFR